MAFECVEFSCNDRLVADDCYCLAEGKRLKIKKQENNKWKGDGDKREMQQLSSTNAQP